MIDYNPAFIYPANIDCKFQRQLECKTHRKACRIFKGLSYELWGNHQCKCCGRSIGEDDVQIPICYNPVEQLISLGPGVPLLFVFSRIAILLLIVLTLLYAIYAMISNLNGSSCKLTAGCQETIFIQLSIANKIYDSKNLNIQNYLLVGFIFLYILFIQYLTYFMRKKERDTDEMINSPSDYSILISQLPKGCTQNDILRMIEEERHFLDKQTREQTDNLSIKDIIMSYDLTEYLKQTEEEEGHFLEAKKQDVNCGYHFKHIRKPTEYSSLAIVIFNRQEANNVFDQPQTWFNSIRNFLFHFCLKYGRFQINKEPVVVERGPEPDDIIWKNASIPRASVIRRKILTNFICVCILVLGGYIQYLLQVQKSKIQDKTLVNVYNVVASAMVAIFNFIISIFIQFVTKTEGDCTQTDLNSSILVKTSLFEFFNAGVFYTFARIAAQQTDKFDIQGNEAYETTLFMIFNAIIPQILNIVVIIFEVPNSIFRCLYLKDCLKYNQKQANEIFQCPQIQFPIKYAYIIRTIWLACFYASFVPVVVPISAGGLVLFYLGQQFLFRNYYSVPFMLSKKIVFTAITLLNYTGLIMLSGSFLIVYYISYKLNAEFTIIEAIPFIIGLILSLFIILIPSIRINQRLFPLTASTDNSATYDQALPQFAVTYKGTHPLSSYAQRMKRSEVKIPKLFKMIEMKTKDMFRKTNFRQRPTDQESLNNPLNRLFT